MQTIILKSYDLLKALIPALSKIPRNQKFLLGDRIQNIVSDVMETFVQAYYCPKEQKIPLLKQANISLETLRYYLRLCRDFKYFSLSQFESLCEKNDEVGRMLGGWIKSLEK